MVRTLWLGALLATAASAQAPEAVSRTGTAEMMRMLERIEPKDGWLATPPGLSGELWDYYRTAFGVTPKGNEPNDIRVGLGKLLFFDKRLSRDRTLSCASCHDPKHGFAEPRAKSIGIGGQVMARNAPTIMNAGLQRSLFWDGRAKTLEEQAAGPILNPSEMGMPNRDAVEARVRELPEYEALFELAYDRAPEFDDIARALASFQRTLVFVDAPFDAFRAGNKDAISADAKKGFDLFATHCRSCHPVTLRAPLLSDGNFHNVGIGFESNDHQALGRAAFPKVRAADRDASVDVGDIIGQYGELGRALVTKLEYQVGAFRTAPLRNVALTAPYMHDGSLATLWDVVDHYNRGGTPNTWQDPQITELKLSDTEVDQMVAFLFSLTDRRFEVENKREHEAQRRRARRAKSAGVVK